MPVWQNPIDFTTQLWAITFAFLFLQQILIDFRFLPPSSILQRTLIFILQIGCNSSCFMPIPRVVMALLISKDQAHKSRLEMFDFQIFAPKIFTRNKPQVKNTIPGARWVRVQDTLQRS
jgi:hypothetical protein